MKRDFPDSETAYPVDGISRGQSGAKPKRPELTSANGAPQGFLTSAPLGANIRSQLDSKRRSAEIASQACHSPACPAS